MKTAMTNISFLGCVFGFLETIMLTGLNQKGKSMGKSYPLKNYGY